MPWQQGSVNMATTSDGTKAELLRLLTSTDERDKLGALEQIQRKGMSSAAPAVAKLLASPDAGVRSAAAATLGNIGRRHPGAIGQRLLVASDDPEQLVRAEAAEAIGKLGYEPGRRRVCELLSRDPSGLVRACAAEALGGLGQDRGALAALLGALHDKDSAVRGFAAYSIGKIGNLTHARKLEPFLRSERSLGVRAEIAGARYRLGVVADFGSILELLDRARNEHSVHRIINVLRDHMSAKMDAPEAAIARARDVLTRALAKWPRFGTELRLLLDRLPSGARLPHRSPQ